jgi:hypothetical protein
VTPAKHSHPLGIATRADGAALAALAAWLLAATVATAVRPGELFEMSLIAAAGAVAWGILATDPSARRMRAVAALMLAIPLVNTWPARAWVAAFDETPTTVQVLLAPSTLLIAAAVSLAPRRLPSRETLPYAIAAGALLVAAAISSLLSDHPGDALAATIHSYAFPAALGVATAASVHRVSEGWTLIQLAAIGAAVPAIVGVAAYIVSFGVPLSSAELLEAKVALVRPYLFQELTFGNVGHLADLVLLTLPAAVLGSVFPDSARWLRVASGIAAAALSSALLLTASRSAMAIAGAEMAFIATLLLVIRRPRSALAPLAVLAVLAVVALSPDVRRTYSELVPSVNVSELQVTVLDESAVVRLRALETGLRIAGDNLPFGIGPGQYRASDELYTAPHSLLIQILAENGILGGLAALALAALLATDGVRGLRAGQRANHDLFLLRAASLVGAFGFLLHGIAAGAPLAVGQVNVWAALFWLQVGVVAALREVPSHAK